MLQHDLGKLPTRSPEPLCPQVGSRASPLLISCDLLCFLFLFLGFSSMTLGDLLSSILGRKSLPGPQAPRRGI